LREYACGTNTYGFDLSALSLSPHFTRKSARVKNAKSAQMDATDVTRCWKARYADYLHLSRVLVTTALFRGSAENNRKQRRDSRDSPSACELFGGGLFHPPPKGEGAIVSQ